ncbi:MAG: hypothetical protein U5R49_09600 [Deltaproteobacteria bacterium]|nr:hypothetical protein [Deltaproteobacteria bacterium]
MTTFGRDTNHDHRRELPQMLFADDGGRIFDHPYLRMAGFSGSEPAVLVMQDLMQMPEFSKLFFIPQCPPVGLDPETGGWEIVPEMEVDGRMVRCHAVAAFLEPGVLRTHLPAADYSKKRYRLPMWAYTAVGFKDGEYWAAGFEVERIPSGTPGTMMTGH